MERSDLYLEREEKEEKKRRGKGSERKERKRAELLAYPSLQSC